MPGPASSYWLLIQPFLGAAPRPAKLPTLKTSSIISAPVVITGRSSRRYTTSVVRVEACPASRAISSMLTPQWLRLANEVRSSHGV